MKIQGDNFFDCSAVELARNLLGKILCVQTDAGVIRKMITETEAYGIDDTACHCYKGRTNRTEPMFRKGGTVYVYLCYGIHEILNIASGKEDQGQGVMIRGIEGAVGPGRVTKALGVDRSYNFEQVTTSSRIWLEEGIDVTANKIQELKRVGIDYAAQHDIDKLWRFRLLNASSKE